LIEGAAEGAGLGHRFLRHLERTRLLLHVVDVLPLGGEGDPVTQAQAIAAELAKFAPELAAQPRWLVLNKIDLIPADDRQGVADEIVAKLEWQGPVYPISALAREGTAQLARDVMVYLEQAEDSAEDYERA
jgi:GTP-binding protein